MDSNVVVVVVGYGGNGVMWAEYTGNKQASVYSVLTSEKYSHVAADGHVRHGAKIDILFGKKVSFVSFFFFSADKKSPTHKAFHTH